MITPRTAALNLTANGVPERLLLGPGPSNADPAILEVMSAPLVGHLDPFFLQVMDGIQEMLRQVFLTSNDLTLAVPGTGTAAMEAAVANLVGPGDPVLVAANGYFGERIAEIARRSGAEVRVLTCPWGEVFNPADLRRALEEQPARMVALVHAETSTGALQPLDEIARLVHAQGGLVLIDAVTSLGGLPLHVDASGLDVVYSGAQKCLSCPPGLSPITLSPAAVAVLEGRSRPSPGFYLDLGLLRRYWGPERAYHHTAPISTAYGFHEALRLVLEEGLEVRWARHRDAAEYLWQGLDELGLELHVPAAFRLPTLTTVRIPAGVEDPPVRNRLLDEFGIEIGGGLGKLKGKVWRIGLMGTNANHATVDRLLEALQVILG